MSERSKFWNGTTVGDGTLAPYDAATSFAEVLMSIAGATLNSELSGVFADLHQLACSSPSAGVVDVDTGRALVYGTWYENNAILAVSIPTPAAATRTDRIVLRKDWVAQTVRVVRIAGAEGGGAPAMTEIAGTTWDTRLCTVTIATSGVTTVFDNRTFLGGGALSGVTLVAGDVLYAASPASLATVHIAPEGAILRSTGAVPAWSTVVQVHETGTFLLDVQINASGLPAYTRMRNIGTAAGTYAGFLAQTSAGTVELDMNIVGSAGVFNGTAILLAYAVNGLVIASGTAAPIDVYMDVGATPLHVMNFTAGGAHGSVVTAYGDLVADGNSVGAAGIFGGTTIDGTEITFLATGTGGCGIRTGGGGVLRLYVQGVTNPLWILTNIGGWQFNVGANPSTLTNPYYVATMAILLGGAPVAIGAIRADESFIVSLLTLTNSGGHPLLAIGDAYDDGLGHTNFDLLVRIHYGVFAGARLEFWASGILNGYYGNGLVVGASGTADRGVGTIEVATNVYLHGTAYTNPDFLFELAYTGKVTEYQTPAWEHYRRIVGDELMSIGDVEAYVRDNWHFPVVTKPGQHGHGVFTDEYGLGRDDISLILHEQAYVYLFDHERRIKELERELAELRAGV